MLPCANILNIKLGAAEPPQFSHVVRMTINDGLLDTISGPVGTQVHLKMLVTLSGPPAMEVDASESYEIFKWQDHIDLTTSPIGNPPNIEFSFREDKLVATLRSSTPWPVTIRATPKNCEGAGEYDYVFSEYMVAGNVEAPIDVGARYGLPISPKRYNDFFDIDFRANLGNQNLRDIKFKMTYNNAYMRTLSQCDDSRGIDVQGSTSYSCDETGCFRNPDGIRVSLYNSKWNDDSDVYPTEGTLTLATQRFRIITYLTVEVELKVYIETFKREITKTGETTWGSFDSNIPAVVVKLLLNPPLLNCMMVENQCQNRELYWGGTGDSCPCAADFYGSGFSPLRPESPPLPPSLPPPPSPPYPAHPPPWSPPMTLAGCGNVTDIQFGPTTWSYNPWAIDSIVGVNGTQMNIHARVKLDTGVVIDLPDPTGEYKASDYITLSTILDDEDCDDCSFLWNDFGVAYVGMEHLKPKIGFDDLNSAYVATLWGNSFKPVMIRASTLCQGAGEPRFAYADNIIAGNIENEHADDDDPQDVLIDLGARYGLAMPQIRHGETLSVDIRANTGNLALIMLQMNILFDATHLSSKTRHLVSPVPPRQRSILHDALERG